MPSKKDIKLTPEEIDFISDQRLFPLKNNITQKVCELLAEVRDELKFSPLTKTFPFPPKTDKHTGKISRGEQYKSQPYLILDYPRNFHQKNVFTFRTMFWWGHYFLLILHIRGQYVGRYRQAFLRNAEGISESEAYFYKGSNPWEHEITTDQYVSLQNVKIGEIKAKLAEGTDLKMVKTLNLYRWEELASVARSTYHEFLNLLL